MRLVAKLVAAALAASVGYAGVAYATESSPITVDRVVDGDTIDVWKVGELVRVRLLNIDAPETKDPNQPPECLGPEAADFLEQRLPPGTRVELQYDLERFDRYGRTLAGVFESGKLVNAEIAAAGLGAPVVFEPNRRFYPEVLAAAQEAQARQLGAYAPTIECTLPSQVPAALAALAASDASDDDWSTEDHLHAISSIETSLIRVQALRSLLSSTDSSDERTIMAFYADAQRAEWVRTLDEAISRGRQQRDSHQMKVDQIRAAEQAAAEQAAQEAADAARIAEEKAEAERIAEEKAEAERIAKQKAAAKKKTSGGKKHSSGGSSSGGGYPGYTGPRCYAPGGKTWRPC